MPTSDACNGRDFVLRGRLELAARRSKWHFDAELFGQDVLFGYAVLFGQVQRHGALTYSRKLGHAGACGHATKYAYAW